MSALDNEDSDDELFGMSMSSLADAMGNATKDDELEEKALNEKSSNISLICDSFLKGITSGDSNLFNSFVTKDTLGQELKDEIKSIESSFKLIQSGAYMEVLSTTFAQQLYSIKKNDEEEGTCLDTLRKRAITFINTGNDEYIAFRILEIMSIAVASLNLFLQINYTGPEIEENEIPLIPLVDDNDKNKNNAINLLAVDGEIPCTGSDGTSLLLTSRILFGLISDPTIALWNIPVSINDESNETHSIIEGNNIWKCCESDLRIREKATLSMVNTCKELRGYTAWWSGRAIVTHQRLFIAGGTSTTLWTEFCHCFKQVLLTHCNGIDPKIVSLNKTISSLSAEAWLEFGLGLFHFEKSDMGKLAFEAARRCASLHVEMTGALGKRTKFQQRSLAQMVVKATTIRSIDKPNNSEGADGADDGTTHTQPHTEQQGEDSILFEHTHFDKEEDKLEGVESLVGEQLSVLLALCLDVKNSNPKDGLTTEEMKPYIERVLIHPYNWTIYSTGLLQRAWLDFESTYARDRATLQLQALVDQHGKTLTFTQLSRDVIEASANVIERLRYLHCVVYPPRWELKKDLANKYHELGILVSASELYISLELWDDVVDCYSRMGRRKDALLVVQEQKDKGCTITPRMLCSIGNLLEAPESTKYFEQAWELSDCRYSKAMRSAGREAVQLADQALVKESKIREKLNNPTLALSVSEDMALKHVKECEDYLLYAEKCLDKALSVHPSFTSDWFVLGTVRMRLNKWQSSLTCFSTVVSHQPDAGDAWGNVGAIHMRLKRPDLALAAFTEGLKASRDSWRMWENRLLSGLQIKPNPPAPDVVLSATELLNLYDRGMGRGVDTAMLAAIVSAVLRYEGIDVSGFEKGNPTPALNLNNESFLSEEFNMRHVVKKCGFLLERTTSSTKSSNDPKAWELFAIYNTALGRRQAARECRMKHCRQLIASNGWEKRVNDMNMIADAVHELVQLHTLPLGLSTSIETTSIDENCADTGGVETALQTEQKALYNLLLFVGGINKRATALGTSGDPAREILNASKEQIEAMVAASSGAAGN